jgi:hypothetical protein
VPLPLKRNFFPTSLFIWSFWGVFGHSGKKKDSCFYQKKKLLLLKKKKKKILLHHLMLLRANIQFFFQHKTLVPYTFIFGLFMFFNVYMLL